MSLGNRYKRFRKRFLNRSRERGILTCQYCGRTNLFVGKTKKRSPERRATVDHVIPLSKGGGLIDKDNVVICCLPCNVAKGSTDPESFLASEWLIYRRMIATKLNSRFHDLHPHSHRQVPLSSRYQVSTRMEPGGIQEDCLS